MIDDVSSELTLLDKWDLIQYVWLSLLYVFCFVFFLIYFIFKGGINPICFFTCATFCVTPVPNKKANMATNIEALISYWIETIHLLLCA